MDYIRADHQLTTITDRNPDPKNTDPNAPEPVETESFNFGYTGRTYGAQPADGTVELAVHDAAAGEVVLADQKTPGSGEYNDVPDIGGTMTTQPTVGPVAKNRLNTAGHLLTVSLTANGTSLSDWADLGGSGLNGTLSVVAGSNGLDSVFARAGDGTIVTSPGTADVPSVITFDQTAAAAAKVLSRRPGSTSWPSPPRSLS